MLENQCALEIENPDIASPEMVNPEILNLESVHVEIVNLEIVNCGGEGATRRRGGNEVTSDCLMKDLTEEFVWTQG